MTKADRKRYTPARPRPSPSTVTITIDLDGVRMDKIRSELRQWTDRKTYDADVRRILWAVDAAMRKRETGPRT